MSPFSILLAEDEIAHIKLIEFVLHKACPEMVLTTVTTGEKFLETLKKEKFDCILLDINLPDYRADKLLPLIPDKSSQGPIIVISSSNDRSVVTRCLLNGSIDFIHKSEALQQGDALWQRIDAALLKQRTAKRERRRIARRMNRLTQLAETDSLTGLFNRLYLERFLSGKRQIYDRRGPVSCVMLDLDHFKRVNDVYGHLAGDRVLCCVADILREFANPDDTLCRWGGEEFLVFLASSTLEHALHWAEAVRQRIDSRWVPHENHILRVTASFGVADYRNDRPCEDTLLQVDKALYLAKCSGRNRVCTSAMVSLEAILNGCADRTKQTGRDAPEVDTFVGPRSAPSLAHL